MSNEREPPDRSGSETLNDQIRTAVCQGLAERGHSGLGGVTVHVENDRIVLTGTVPSYFLKQVAQEAARRACPDRRVYNQLDVPQTAGGRRQP